MSTRTLGTTAISIVQGDIASMSGDAIVNAANAALAGGGGVDGALHRAGGRSIADACAELPWVAPGVKCPTGEVRTTTAGALSARFLVHAVGPIYDSRDVAGSEQLLAAAYRAALVEAQRLGCRAVVLPALSTGAYRFPLRPAARVALEAVRAFVEERPEALDRVTFAVFSPRDLQVFGEALAQV